MACEAKSSVESARVALTTLRGKSEAARGDALRRVLSRAEHEATHAAVLLRVCAAPIAAANRAPDAAGTAAVMLLRLLLPVLHHTANLHLPCTTNLHLPCTNL